jgi:hypothetical protein
MTKQEFLFNLKGASLVSLKFAENYIKNKLTTDFKYNVILNSSTDDPKLTQFDIYREDDGIMKLDLTDQEVVELLYRKGKVPVWIDINVLKSSRKSTTFNLLCAGRYSDDKKEYYYNENGSGPFGIKSPKLPVDYKEGKKFKLK